MKNVEFVNLVKEVEVLVKIEIVIECTHCEIELDESELIDNNYCPQCRCSDCLAGYIFEVDEDE